MDRTAVATSAAWSPVIPSSLSLAMMIFRSSPIMAAIAFCVGASMMLMVDSFPRSVFVASSIAA